MLIQPGHPDWNENLPGLLDLWVVANREKINLLELMLSNDYIISTKDVVVPIVAGVILGILIKHYK